MEYKIIENFIDREEFSLIKNTMLKNDFPWYFNEEKTPESKELYNFQFTHVFYDRMEKKSYFYNLIEPIIKKIDPLALLRIKANLTTFLEKQYLYDYHVDTEEDSFTAVYYVNTNNGYTLFKNGDRVKSIENSILLFPSNYLHTAVSANDSKTRCVININFLRKKSNESNIF